MLVSFGEGLQILAEPAFEVSGKGVRNHLWSHREVKIRHRGSPRNQKPASHSLSAPKAQHNGS